MTIQAMLAGSIARSLAGCQSLAYSHCALLLGTNQFHGKLVLAPGPTVSIAFHNPAVNGLGVGALDTRSGAFTIGMSSQGREPDRPNGVICLSGMERTKLAMVLA